jgi:hypothetical protein
MQAIRKRAVERQEFTAVWSDGEIRDVPTTNHTFSECGRFESFDINGYHFEVDWNEIDPPGFDEDPEDGIPHEQVMREMWEILNAPAGSNR